MKIFDKWLVLKGCIPPGLSPEGLEEARRIFYAGATAAFEVLIVETNGQAVGDQVNILTLVEKELIQHRDELAKIYRGKVN